MVEIEINGKRYEAEDGAMIIEIADREGIHIPRFCYHKKLSIAANCRMCLIEVEKSPKALPACATPVMPGMKVFTESAVAREAQHAVMEFLLINHPLDCPICDQGGECELQDVAMGYGQDASHYTQGKRVVQDEDIGPLVQTDMTRCIHCTRCVRFGEEVAGVRDLGLTQRGGHARIGTYVEASMKSELAGNVIDLCPVGALTAKPSLFNGRAWEFQQHASISPHDCVGSNLALHTRRGQVMRVVPQENESINETWIADRDRFSYVGFNHADRLEKPMIKTAEGWQAVDWLTALDAAVTGLRATLNRHGAEQLGALAAPHSTLEELFLLQAIMRDLGSNNVDHRVHQQDFSDDACFSACPGFDGSLAELDELDAFLLVGSEIYREQPIIANRLRNAVRHNGAKACVVGMLDSQRCHFNVAHHLLGAAGEQVDHLGQLAKAISTQKKVALPAAWETLLSGIVVGDAANDLAKTLVAGKNVGVLIGSAAMNHASAATLRGLTHVISELLGAKALPLSDGGNSQGAWLAGMVPHRDLRASSYALATPGLNAQSMFAEGLRAYVLMNLEPERDCAESAVALRALEQAAFVLSLSPYMTDAMQQYADVILPITPFAETSGTFVNVNKTWQSFAGCVPAVGESRPGWKVLRVLANQLDLAGFDYQASTDVRDEVKQLFEQRHAELAGQIYCPESLPEKTTELTRLGSWPLYASDNLVRRSAPLQATPGAGVVAAVMHPEQAVALGLQDEQAVTAVQGEQTLAVKVKLDARVAPGNVELVSGEADVAGFGCAFGTIEIRA